MARKTLTYETPIMVKLEPEEKRRLKVQVAREGTDISKLVRRLLREYLDEAEAPAEPADRTIERMANTATTRLTTAEIMALTRGD
jgi:hypothetical protein